jgi:hypothetical protein
MVGARQGTARLGFESLACWQHQPKTLGATLGIGLLANESTCDGLLEQISSLVRVSHASGLA